MKKEILMTECLASARTIYRKLKHLHQVKWLFIPNYKTGSVMIDVPGIDATYVWNTDNTLESHSRSAFYSYKTTYYKNYDLKLFIKVMKKILKRKSFNLNYEE